MNEEKSLRAGAETFKAQVISPPGGEIGSGPGLIIVHEIWGLDKHIKDVAGRFAAQGYGVVAPDLLSDTGILQQIRPTLFADLRDPQKKHEAQAKMRTLLQPLQSEEFARSTMAKVQACFDYLGGASGRVGVVGFCFGGTWGWHLATTEPKLKAAVCFYGQPPQPLEKVADIRCPVLALYGEQDERLMASLPDVQKAMKEHGKDFTCKIYPKTGHAFFNDTNPQAFNQAARDDAWGVTVGFLRANVG